jgi:D-alanyl-D-alanine carboxypeptidase
MRRGSLAGGLVCLTLVVAGCGDPSGDANASHSTSGSSNASAALPTTPMSAADVAALDKVISGVHQAVSKDYPALWVGVWSTEKGAYVKAFGKSEVGKADATVDDTFRIGSVTKSVTATVILQLVDQGKLTLADPVSKAAPQVAKDHPEIADRTIEQLLGMTSGIPDYMNVPDGIVAGVSQDPGQVWTADDLIRAGISEGLKKPGTPGYSTTNYIILQEIAEELTGKPLADLITANVTGPLGMTHTVLPPNDNTALADPGSHGYLNALQELKADGGKAKKGQDVTDWNASYGQGGGGMSSTITDHGEWGASGLGDSLLTSQTAVTRATTTELPNGIKYGLGIIDYGDGFLGHPGEAIGWQAQVSHNPTTGVTVAVATNACAGADLMMFDAIRGLAAFTLTPPSDLPSADPSQS